MVTRAAIYCRLSYDPQGKKIGVEVQEADARVLAASLGADVVAVLVDDDITAADPTVVRPAFEQLLEGTLAGDWDVIVAWDQHRLLRMIADMERVIGVCTVARVQLHYVKQGASDLESPEGKLFARFNALLGEYEVEKIRVRTRRNMAARADRGLPYSGAPGYGYEKDASSDAYRVVEDEATVVKQMAVDVLAGVPLLQIARALNERGVLRRGVAWRPQAVKRVLLSPRVAGLREHRGQVVGAASWPAILDELTWRRVGSLLRDPRRRSWATRPDYLLTGIAECGKCLHTVNHTLHHDTTRTPARVRGVYFCRWCRGVMIADGPVDALVRDLVVAFVDGDALAASMAGDVDDQGVDHWLGEVDEVRALRAEFAAERAAGRMEPEEWQAARAALGERERAARAALEAARRDDGGLSEWLGRGDELGVEWNGLPLLERRSHVREAFRWVRIMPGVKGSNRFDARRVDYRFAI